MVNARSIDDNVSVKDVIRRGSKQRAEAQYVNVGDEEIRMLRRLLELPPHRLRILRKTIERIEKYSDQERDLMRRNLNSFRAKEQEERRKVLENLKKRHDLLKLYLSKLGPEKRVNEAKKFHALSIQDKRKFLEDLNRTAEKRKQF